MIGHIILEVLLNHHSQSFNQFFRFLLDNDFHITWEVCISLLRASIFHNQSLSDSLFIKSVIVFLKSAILSYTACVHGTEDSLTSHIHEFLNIFLYYCKKSNTGGWCSGNTSVFGTAVGGSIPSPPVFYFKKFSITFCIFKIFLWYG